MITGLYVPTEGRITFDGTDLTGRKPHEVVRLGIARTFQNIRLFGNMTAEENVLVGPAPSPEGPLVRRDPAPALDQARGGRGARQGAWTCSSSSDSPRRSQTLARNLPYGDQRRLEIARALATDRSCCSSTSRRPG